jgi:NitT/TauT family transport system ATP-binding protein
MHTIPQDIVLDNISKSFPVGRDSALQVLKRISLKVTEKEFVVLIGPSGCGKTTLLRIIAGLEKPSEGRISIGGVTVTNADKNRGMVFQSYNSFPWLTVVENVLFGLNLNDENPRKNLEAARHYLNIVELSNFERYYPNQLSGGMRQRMAIARTLATEPKILLMDEPFGSLDSRTRVSMQDLILKIWENEQKTIVFVTHDLEEAVYLADRICVCSKRPTEINSERIVDISRPRNIGHRAQADFVEIERELRDLLEKVHSATANENENV